MAPSIEQRTRILRDFFVGRRDTFTEQQPPDALMPYLAIKKELTDPELMAHCRGEKTISTYLVDDQGNTPVAVLDIDSKEEPAKQIITFAKNWLKGYGLQGFVEPSGRKGYHIWVVFKNRMPAAKAKRMLEALVSDWLATWNRWAQAEKKPFPFTVKDKGMGPLLTDFEGKEVHLPFLIEINPKQEQKTSLEAPGSCVKLPWGRHRISSKWTAFLDEQGQVPQDWGMSMILQEPPVTEVMLDDILKKYPAKEEVPRQRTQGKFVKTPEQSSEEFNALAVKLALESCAFLQHCAKDAADLSRNQWFCMVDLLAPFGDVGAKRIHELSSPYPKYSPRETDQYIDSALKVLSGAGKKKAGPYTCVKIQESLGFSCPSTCQAKNLDATSPAGLAFKLANQEMVVERTHSVTIITTKTGKQKVLVHCPTLAEEIMHDYMFKTIKDTEELYSYQDGIFVPYAECLVKEEVARRLGGLTTRSRTAETEHYIKVKNYMSRDEFDKDPYILNLNNGLFDIRTKELKPHTPDYPSVMRIPLTYNPTAVTRRIPQFWREILGEEAIPLMEELFGFCLDPTYRIHKAFLFLGSGANGKTTLIELLRAFLGRKNCATVSLQMFITQRFGAAQLWGKLANLYADLPSTVLQNAGLFRMLTGQDTVNAEKKYYNPFDFTNRAKLIFSANRPPRIQNEDSYAFWRRWLLLEFPHEFAGDKADKNLLEKLSAPEELSGLFNLALVGLNRISTNGDFSYQPTAEETAEHYFGASDPIYAFVGECCLTGAEYWSAKEDLYKAFKAFCIKKKLPVLKKESFGRALKNCAEIDNVKTERHRVMGTITYGWQGITLETETEDGSEPKTGEQDEGEDAPPEIPF